MLSSTVTIIGPTPTMRGTLLETGTLPCARDFAECKLSGHSAKSYFAECRTRQNMAKYAGAGPWLQIEQERSGPPRWTCLHPGGGASPSGPSMMCATAKPMEVSKKLFIFCQWLWQWPSHTLIYRFYQQSRHQRVVTGPSRSDPELYSESHEWFVWL